MRSAARKLYFLLITIRTRFARHQLRAKALPELATLPTLIAWFSLLCVYSAKRILQNALKRNIPRSKEAWNYSLRVCQSQLLIKLRCWATQPPLRYSNPYFPIHCQNNRLTNYEAELQRRQAEDFVDPPLISIITPVYNAQPHWLKRLAQSLLCQTYSRWEWIVIDDGSDSQLTSEALARIVELDDRISLDRMAVRCGVSSATNRGVDLSHGSFVCFVDHDDELMPDALWWTAKTILTDSAIDVIYTDEELNFEAAGTVLPSFKPEYSPETLIGYNYVCHLLTVRRSAFETIGGFRSQFDGAQDYDLVLRLSRTAAKFAHIPRVLYRWNLGSHSCSRVPASHVGGFDHSSQLSRVTNQLVQEHLASLGVEAQCSGNGPWPRIHFQPKDRGKVSIIICTKDQPRLLARCLNSIEKKTDYPNYEILVVDNGSTKPGALRRLNAIRARHRVVVIPQGPEGFSFSKLNNEAVKMCDGKFILFLNDDTEVRVPNWLSAMTALATFENVGAVGAKLLFADRTLQHVGVIMGAFGWAPWHALRQRKPTQRNAWYADRTHNVLGVTGACMLLRKALFEDLGGFDEADFAVNYNDVDLCLRLNQRGYRNVVCNEAELIHFESQSRVKQLNLSEGSALARKYRGTVDPYWNPQFSRDDDRLNPSGRRTGRSLDPLSKPHVLIVTDSNESNAMLWPTIDAFAKTLEDSNDCQFTHLAIDPNSDDVELVLAKYVDLNRFDVLFAQGQSMTPAIEFAASIGLKSVWHLPGLLMLPRNVNAKSQSQFARLLLALSLPYRVIIDDAFCKATANQAFECANFQTIESVLFGDGCAVQPAPSNRNGTIHPLVTPTRPRTFLAIVENAEPDFMAIVAHAFDDLCAKMNANPSLSGSTLPRLIIVSAGSPADPPAESVSSRFANEVRVESFKGDWNELLDEADVLITRAITRTRSLPLLLALEKNIPILATVELVPSEVLFEGCTGLVFAPHSTRRLTAAMEQLTESDSLLAFMRDQIELWKGTRSRPEEITKCWSAVFHEAAELHPRQTGFRIGKVSPPLTEKISPYSNFANAPRA